MKRIRRARGFGLFELTLTLTILSVVLSFAIPAAMSVWRSHQVEKFVTHLKTLSTQILQYQYHRVKTEGIDPTQTNIDSLQSWPADIDALMTDYDSIFWIECRLADEANELCLRPDRIPFTNTRLRVEPFWDTTSGYGLSRFYITVPTGELPNDGSWARWALPLLTIHGARQRANGDIQISLTPLTKTTQYREYLKKDGSTPLTGDWDVGGNSALTNVRDMTINNSDGTQKSVVNKLTEIYTVSHGQAITKPKCPSGMTVDYNLSVSEITPISGYENSGEFKAYILSETSMKFIIGLDVMSKINYGVNSGRLIITHNGFVTVFLQCK
ncbi:hypothetical protein MACH09_45390 [Vibrio sp. MACH09]|uniref:pilus assembly FimT family protein n=1 Tax=Vibrio sp. MACH09 TaxID=3025122 RepID=UPI0027921EF8|nr:hypothetical protein [Vibrio sp. MACH09]GLO64031.1 hypothetical protein MACH09_45390 [Vibrio sp. MACH09]